MSAGSLLHASVGAYRLVDFLGAGGMGEVYRGVHVNLGRVVAVKVLSSPGQAGSLLERFKNEAQIQATLQHPNVVALYDFLELGGRPCIVMEYVDGQTIDAKVRREGPIDPAEAIGLFESIAGAVGYLHNRGIVHRDLKPGNIKISESNCVKLLDFGLAKGAGTPKLTATGMVVGTLEYMAPEQLAQQPADERTDIWALGVVLYEMVTGRLPFQSTSVGDLLRRIAQAEYFPASTVNPAVPRQFDGIIAACLKQNPDHRLRSVDRLLAQVRPIAARLRRESLPEGPVREVGTSPRSRLAALVTGFVTSPQTRLAAILLASFAILASIGVAIARDPSPGPGPFPVPAPVPAPTTRSEAAVACGLASSTDRSERIREVTIDVPSGWAKVRCGAAELGRTPLVVRVEIGKTVGLTLVRDGFADERIEFAPTSCPPRSRAPFSSPGFPFSSDGGTPVPERCRASKPPTPMARPRSAARPGSPSASSLTWAVFGTATRTRSAHAHPST
jgi:serine/threonine-protein kinase